jgi:PAS domain-containing protein
MYGVEKEEFVGASMKAFTQEVARGEAQIAEILQVGACQSFESVHLTRKGRKVNVLVSSSVIKYRGQQAILSFIREITERKQTEEALAESEERFRTLVENATVGIYRTTPDGRIIMANPAIVKMLGYNSFQELASRNLEEQGFDRNT